MKYFTPTASAAALLLPALFLIYVGIERGVEAAALMRVVSLQGLFTLALLYACSEPRQKGSSL